MIFPSWGAIVGNILNAQNNKNSNGLPGSYKPIRKPTKKDLIVGLFIPVMIILIIYLLFIYIMYLEHNEFIEQMKLLEKR